MPKPDFDQIQPKDVLWIEAAICFYTEKKDGEKYYKYGIERLKRIKEILSSTTVKEYGNNEWN